MNFETYLRMLDETVWLWMLYVCTFLWPSRIICRKMRDEIELLDFLKCTRWFCEEKKNTKSFYGMAIVNDEEKGECEREKEWGREKE